MFNHELLTDKFLLFNIIINKPKTRYLFILLEIIAFIYVSSISIQMLSFDQSIINKIFAYININSIIHNGLLNSTIFILWYALCLLLTLLRVAFVVMFFFLGKERTERLLRSNMTCKSFIDKVLYVGFIILIIDSNLFVYIENMFLMSVAFDCDSTSLKSTALGLANCSDSKQIIFVVTSLFEIVLNIVIGFFIKQFQFSIFSNEDFKQTSFINKSELISYTRNTILTIFSYFYFYNNMYGLREVMSILTLAVTIIFFIIDFTHNKIGNSEFLYRLRKTTSFSFVAYSAFAVITVCVLADQSSLTRYFFSFSYSLPALYHGYSSFHVVVLITIPVCGWLYGYFCSLSKGNILFKEISMEQRQFRTKEVEKQIMDDISHFLYHLNNITNTKSLYYILNEFSNHKLSCLNTNCSCKAEFPIEVKDEVKELLLGKGISEMTQEEFKKVMSPYKRILQYKVNYFMSLKGLIRENKFAFSFYLINLIYLQSECYHKISVIVDDLKFNTKLSWKEKIVLSILEKKVKYLVNQYHQMTSTNNTAIYNVLRIIIRIHNLEEDLIKNMSQYKDILTNIYYNPKINMKSMLETMKKFQTKAETINKEYKQMIYSEDRLLHKSLSFNFKFYLYSQIFYKVEPSYEEEKFCYILDLINQEFHSKYPNNKLLIEIENNKDFVMKIVPTELARLLQYEINELENNNIDIIIPNFLRCKHIEYQESFLSMNLFKQISMQKFVLNKKGYLVNFNLLGCFMSYREKYYFFSDVLINHDNNNLAKLAVAESQAQLNMDANFQKQGDGVEFSRSLVLMTETGKVLSFSEAFESDFCLFYEVLEYDDLNFNMNEIFPDFANRSKAKHIILKRGLSNNKLAHVGINLSNANLLNLSNIGGNPKSSQINPLIPGNQIANHTNAAKDSNKLVKRVKKQLEGMGDDSVISHHHNNDPLIDIIPEYDDDQSFKFTISGKFYRGLLNSNAQYYNLAMDYNEDIKKKLKEFNPNDKDMKGTFHIIKKIDLSSKNQLNKFIINKVEINLDKLYIAEIHLIKQTFKPKPILIQGISALNVEPTEKHFFNKSLFNISTKVKGDLEIIKPIMIIFSILSLGGILLLLIFNSMYISVLINTQTDMITYYHNMELTSFGNYFTMINNVYKIYSFESNLPSSAVSQLNDLRILNGLYEQNIMILHKDIKVLNTDYLIDQNAYLFYGNFPEIAQNPDDVDQGLVQPTNVNITYAYANGNDFYQVYIEEQVTKLFLSYFNKAHYIASIPAESIYSYYILQKESLFKSSADVTYDFDTITYWKEAFNTPLFSVLFYQQMILRNLIDSNAQDVKVFYYIIAIVCGVIILLEVFILMFASHKLNLINKSFNKLLTFKTNTVGYILELFALTLSKFETFSHFIIHPTIKFQSIITKDGSVELNVKESPNDHLQGKKKNLNESGLTSTNRKLIKRNTKASPVKLNTSEVEEDKNKKKVQENTMKLGFGIFTTNQELAKKIGIDSEKTQNVAKKKFSGENETPIGTFREDGKEYQQLEEPIINSKEIYNKLGFSVIEYFLYYFALMIKIGLIIFLVIYGILNLFYKLSIYEEYNILMASITAPHFYGIQSFNKAFLQNITTKSITYTQFDPLDYRTKFTTFAPYIDILNKDLISPSGTYLSPLDYTKVGISDYPSYLSQEELNRSTNGLMSDLLTAQLNLPYCTVLTNLLTDSRGKAYYPLLISIANQFNNCLANSFSTTSELSKTYYTAISFFSDTLSLLFTPLMQMKTNQIYAMTADQLKIFTLNMIHGLAYSFSFLTQLDQENSRFFSNVLVFSVVLLGLFYLILVVLLLILNYKIKENNEMQKSLNFFKTSFHNVEIFLNKFKDAEPA